MASVRHLEFSKFDILVCRTVIMLLSTKFRVNWTIKFLRFSHFEFAKFYHFFTWPSLEANFASPHQISLKSDESWLRYTDKTIFKMAAVHHLEFSNFGILVTSPNLILLLTKFCVNRTINH